VKKSVRKASLLAGPERRQKSLAIASEDYGSLVGNIAGLLEAARRSAARTVNALMTATYWEIGRRLVEFEQGGVSRAAYGEKLLQHLADDLGRRFGRGFSVQNLENMRLFYDAFRTVKISQTTSGKSASTPPGQSRKSAKSQTLSGISNTSDPTELRPLSALAVAFPLPWSHYVLLIRRARSHEARSFYHAEALLGGWSVRQLDRQIASQFYERTALSRNKAAMLRKGTTAQADDALSADEEMRDPLVLEFLNLRDEYSESDLESALIGRLEAFLMELGHDFCFVGRQRRLRIGGEWYRVDLLFFHRKLRSLVVIDLKVGKFTHADAGQMHLYLNYAREHWTHPDENPPIGLILCAEKDDAVAKYSLEGLSRVVAREYKLALPDEKRLAAEIEKTREMLERRGRR